MLAQRLAGFGTTIFTEMSALAERTGAINLGQGFPDEDGPALVLDAAVAAIRAGANQYAPLPGVPAAARGDRRAPARALRARAPRRSRSRSARPRRSPPRCSGCASPGTRCSRSTRSTTPTAPAPRSPARAWSACRCARPSGASTPRAAAAVTERTRVLLLNTPHNPTGRVLDRAELEAIAAVCRERDLIAISDEVYEHLVFDGEHVPLATLPGMAERTLTVSSIGKTFSVTGWKTGWACGPAELVAAVRGAKQFMTFAGGTPFQHAAAVALGIAEEHGARLAAELKAKRDRLCDGLERAGAAVLRPAGHLLRQRRRAPARLRRRRRVLPRPARAGGRRRDPHQRCSAPSPSACARSCASRSASATRSSTPPPSGWLRWDSAMPEVKLSHPDKLLFPADGITKADLAAYYEAVAPAMVRHTRERPLNLWRWNAGIDQRRRHPAGDPQGRAGVGGARRGAAAPRRRASCTRSPNDADTLRWLAQLNCVTPHVWTSRVDRLDRPDRMIFDLDPPDEGADFDHIREGALAMGELLRELGHEPYAMTSGSRGIHVVAPLRRTPVHDEVREQHRRDRRGARRPPRGSAHHGVAQEQARGPHPHRHRAQHLRADDGRALRRPRQARRAGGDAAALGGARGSEPARGRPHARDGAGAPGARRRPVGGARTGVASRRVLASASATGSERSRTSGSACLSVTRDDEPAPPGPSRRGASCARSSPRR